MIGKKIKLVKSLLSKWNADILCFQDTKLKGKGRDLVNQIYGGRWIRFGLKASGTRGILMLWDSRIWQGEVLQVGAYTLTCKFVAILQNCHITGVYAPNCNYERNRVWREIGTVRGLMDALWAVWGDFNVFGFPSEKRNWTRDKEIQSNGGVLRFYRGYELID